MGSRSGEGSRFGVKVVVKVSGHGRAVKVRFMIGGHKVGGQGQGIGHWGQIEEGVKVWGPGRGVKVCGGVKVWGSMSRSRLWSMSGVKVRGQGRGVNVRVMIGGHKVWGQGRGSMLLVKVRGVVKVMRRGPMPCGLGSDGRWGEVGDKQSIPFKNS